MAMAVCDGSFQSPPGRPARARRSPRRASSKFCFHRESVPFCGTSAGASLAAGLRADDAHLEEKALGIDPLLQCAISSGERVEPACDSSTRTGSRSDSSEAIRVSPRCVAVCR